MVFSHFVDGCGLVTILVHFVQLLKNQPSGLVGVKSLLIQVFVKGNLHFDCIVQDGKQHQTCDQRLSIPVTSIQVTGCMHYSSLVTVNILKAYDQFLG